MGHLPESLRDAPSDSPSDSLFDPLGESFGAQAGLPESSLPESSLPESSLPESSQQKSSQQKSSQPEPDISEASIAALQNGEAPFVLADSLGQVVSINAAFQRVYGWREEQLRGQSLSLILPGAFQMSHQLGFSRFQATEHSTILAHPLRLKTVCADGTEVVSEHFIVGEKRENG